MGPSPRAALASPGVAFADRAKIFKECAKIIRGDSWSGKEFTRDQAAAAEIAATSVATLAELRTLRWLPVQDEPVTLELLVSRDRAFRDGWAARAFDDVHAGAIRVARRLIVDGLASKPATDGYVVALIAVPGAFDLAEHSGQSAARFASALEVLQRNQDLVDDVWRMFEVEGGGENSLAAHDKYTMAEKSWSHALLALAADGTLDRDRLLDASLAALERGFAQFRVQWFSAFHEALEPTLGDRALRVDRYMSLTASPVGPTVSMALRALAIVDKAGQLDAVNAVDGLGPALLTPTKGSALKAQKLIVSAVRREPNLLPSATHRIVAALSHEALDVQLAAVTQLRQWHREVPEELVTELHNQRAGCHIGVRDQLDEWLCVTTPGREIAPRPSGPYSWTKPAAVNGIAWLAADRAIVPIADFDEFFELTSATLESPSSPDDIERVITFLAESVRSLAGSGRAATLARRAEKLVNRSERSSQVLLGEMICSAFGAPVGLPRALSYRRDGAGRREPTCLDELLVGRARSIATLLGKGQPFTPLASPTHRGGVIDPVTFAQRLESSDGETESAELLSGMLRLAPVPSRLTQASEILKGRRHRKVRDHLRQWAEKCANDSVAGVRWTSSSYVAGTYTHYSLRLEDDGVVTTSATSEIISVYSSQWGSFSGVFTQDLAGIRWVGSLVPGLPEAWARAGISTIGPTYSPKEVAHGDPALLDRYFDPTMPMGESVHLLLALMLNDARSAVFPVAVDLAIASILDSRLDADRLGQYIGDLTGTGCVTPPRWARTLRDVAGHSPVHVDAVVRVLGRAIATAEPRAPHDVLALLELFESLLLETRQTLSDLDTRGALSRFTGTSKTARAASRILNLGRD